MAKSSILRIWKHFNDDGDVWRQPVQSRRHTILYSQNCYLGTIVKEMDNWCPSLLQEGSLKLKEFDYPDVPCGRLHRKSKERLCKETVTKHVPPQEWQWQWCCKPFCSWSVKFYKKLKVSSKTFSPSIIHPSLNETPTFGISRDLDNIVSWGGKSREKE